MNANKICFITCVNDDDLYQRCLFHINKLAVPAGYAAETLPIREAVSMAGGYNLALRHTDAKYKVYLHQDVFVINAFFIQDILNIFNNSEVGMIGVAGSAQIPDNGIWWESAHTFGKVYESHTGVMGLLSFQDVTRDFAEVQCIDGLMMITQYDLPWREDIFTGWHFYDSAHSMEFIQAGYKVVVPRQCEPWCVHDCGVANISNGYEEFRKVFLNEYHLAGNGNE